MNTWISNDSSGKYLYAEALSSDQDFEASMIGSISSANILQAKLVFQDEKRCYECDISGLKPLGKRLEAGDLNAAMISALLVQISNAVNTLRKYLLSESDILLDAAKIFMDPMTQEYRFCVIPGSGNDFEEGLKKLIFQLLTKLDCNDPKTLQLGFRLLQASSEEDFRLHDVMAVIGGSVDSGGRKEAGSFQTLPPVGPEDVQPDMERCIDTAADRNTYMETDSFESEELQIKTGDHPDSEMVSGPKKKNLLFGFLTAQGMLAASVGLIFLLKGGEFVLRMMPVYIILAICITLFYLVDAIVQKIRTSS